MDDPVLTYFLSFCGDTIFFIRNIKKKKSTLNSQIIKLTNFNLIVYYLLNLQICLTCVKVLERRRRRCCQKGRWAKTAPKICKPCFKLRHFFNWPTKKDWILSKPPLMTYEDWRCSWYHTLTWKFFMDFIPKICRYYI